MARIRTIKPEFWQDEVIATLSREARLLFIASLNMADDEGILRWSPEYVKSQAFAFDDDITTPLTEQFMEELTEAALIYPYHGGKAQQRLGVIVNFRKHQKVNRPQPSKLPAPSLQSPEVRRMYGRRDSWTCHICKGQINEKPQVDDRYNLSIDHIKPQSEGGSDHPSNLKAAHQTCNKRRRDNPPPEHHDSLSDSVNESMNGSPPEVEVEREGEKEHEPSPPPTYEKRASARDTAAELSQQAVNANTLQIVNKWQRDRGHDYTRTQLGNLARALDTQLEDGANPDHFPATLDIYHRDGHSIGFIPHAYEQAIKQVGASPAPVPTRPAQQRPVGREAKAQGWLALGQQPEPHSPTEGSLLVIDGGRSA